MTIYWSQNYKKWNYNEKIMKIWNEIMKLIKYWSQNYEFFFFLMKIQDEIVEIIKCKIEIITKIIIIKLWKIWNIVKKTKKRKIKKGNITIEFCGNVREFGFISIKLWNTYRIWWNPWEY